MTHILTLASSIYLIIAASCIVNRATRQTPSALFWVVLVIGGIGMYSVIMSIGFLLHDEVALGLESLVPVIAAAIMSQFPRVEV